MKCFECPKCHRQKFWDPDKVVVVCPGCMIEMEVREDKSD